MTDKARFLIKKKKNWQPKFGPDVPKSGQKLGFLPFPQVWFISLKLHTIIALNNV